MISGASKRPKLGGLPPPAASAMALQGQPWLANHHRTFVDGNWWLFAPIERFGHLGVQLDTAGGLGLGLGECYSPCPALRPSGGHAGQRCRFGGDALLHCRDPSRDKRF
ncbi:hypothetical protein ABPG77_010954 [Micractinium sp. CCAP 211/92]